jgi:hypothetical protein
VLASVEEMDLAPFYEEYRPDGHGRPAYDPKVMALLFYARRAFPVGARFRRTREAKSQEPPK